MLDGLLDETGHDVVHIREVHLRDGILDLIDIETRLKTFDFFFVTDHMILSTAVRDLQHSAFAPGISGWSTAVR